MKKVIALAIFVGALPFFNCASAHAQETEESKSASLLDDYHQKVGFTYGAQAVVQSTYIWRGLCSGAFNIQPSANVGYGGLFVEWWWNIGVEEWTFRTFQPEMDITVGFARWGLNVSMLYVHNFNCGLFDGNNYAGRGNRLQLTGSYTISSKLPLRFLWSTRVAASDGYINKNGETAFAWSSYAEISYTQKLPYDMKLYSAVGISPWRSCYTGYRDGWGVTNIDLRLQKDWSLSEHCGLKLMGQVTINPFLIAADRSSVVWHPDYTDNQSINANIGLGVYLK
jgi:hypothetical protein